MNSIKPYTIIPPKKDAIPFILSIPHCGTDFPSEIKEHYNQDLIGQPDDTDWFLELLYDFASDLGITIIHANYSRWVIDLNRDPESQPLYNDGRIITALTPVTDFLGNSIYAEPTLEPNKDEVERRLEHYYWPYYNKIQDLINSFKKDYKEVFFWDAHSIRSFVPTIRKEKFPELILGNNDETTADSKFIEVSLNSLKDSRFQVNHNTPFKGGHLTRYFGQPQNNVHALQLEMIKTLYMTADELNYDAKHAKPIKEVLKNTFKSLISVLEEMNS